MRGGEAGTHTPTTLTSQHTLSSQPRCMMPCTAHVVWCAVWRDVWDYLLVALWKFDRIGAKQRHTHTHTRTRTHVVDFFFSTQFVVRCCSRTHEPPSKRASEGEWRGEEGELSLACSASHSPPPLTLQAQANTVLAPTHCFFFVVSFSVSSAPCCILLVHFAQQEHCEQERTNQGAMARPTELLLVGTLAGLAVWVSMGIIKWWRKVSAVEQLAGGKFSFPLGTVKEHSDGQSTIKYILKYSQANPDKAIRMWHTVLLPHVVGAHVSQAALSPSFFPSFLALRCTGPFLTPHRFSRTDCLQP